VIVVDTSMAVNGLMGDGPARDLLRRESLHAPHLIDVELTHVLRRRVAQRTLPSTHARQLLDTWRRLGVTRHAIHSMLVRIWELRDNLTAYDAAYVVLAEALDAPLVTADRRLAAAAGPRCPITLVPR
jgi:predicted nucleic acid-binding protein